MDLDINNYNLDDLLKLFKISTHFGESDLKKAKQIVLKTHPDKSGLPSEYFLFYSKAYKILYGIYTFKNKQTKNTNEYQEDFTYSESQNRILTKFFEDNKPIKDHNKFNQWFNQQFEQAHNQQQDAHGYGDWLKTDADIYAASSGTVDEQIKQYKQHVKTVTVYNGINDMESSFNGTLLGDNVGQNFSSSMFSGLSFQDIKQAHTETVIPVSDQDYDKIKKFKNVEEYSRYRNAQNVDPLSEKSATELLNRRVKEEEEMSTSRAYYYAKQQEEVNKKNSLFWGKLQSLTL
jgi:hypothetical protein